MGGKLAEVAWKIGKAMAYTFIAAFAVVYFTLIFHIAHMIITNPDKLEQILLFLGLMLLCLPISLTIAESK